MKTKKSKKFDAVKFFRNIKKHIAKELEGKTFLEQKEIMRKILSGEINIKLT